MRVFGCLVAIPANAGALPLLLPSLPGDLGSRVEAASDKERGETGAGVKSIKKRYLMEFREAIAAALGSLLGVGSNRGAPLGLYPSQAPAAPSHN